MSNINQPSICAEKSKPTKTMETQEEDLSSSDDGIGRIKIDKLNRNNWHEWKNKIENLLISKGQDDLLDEDWTLNNKDSKKFRKINSVAVNMLYQSVNKELKSSINKNNKSFIHDFNALPIQCCQKSMVVICENLFKSLSIIYQHGTSLVDHLTNFQNNYLALKISLETYTNFMHVSTAMAGAFLLRSLHLDESLNVL